MRFDYNALPSRVIFGPGRRTEVEAELERLGIERALVLSTADQSETCAKFANLIGDRLGALGPGDEGPVRRGAEGEDRLT